MERNEVAAWGTNLVFMKQGSPLEYEIESTRANRPWHPTINGATRPFNGRVTFDGKPWDQAVEAGEVIRPLPTSLRRDPYSVPDGKYRNPL